MASVVERSAGLFARKVIARYEGYPIEENERLRNNHIRHHFLTKLYAFATFRTIKAGNFQEDLVKFIKSDFFFFFVQKEENLFELILIIVRFAGGRIKEIKAA